MLKRISDYLRGKGDPPPPSPPTAPRPQLTPWPAPLEQPPAPEQLLTSNWSHPFGDHSDPIQQLTHLAKASNGFYPMGVHGSWHGGVHFDGGTAGVLDQSRVLCLADGEVVAYRIPSTTPTTRYALFPEPAFDAPFASGFVLVRHRIQAPAIEGSDETPPALTFYSLYMHLEDWAAYDGSTLDRPPFWLESDEKWVKDEANDLHKGQRGLKVTGHPDSSRTLDILVPGTQVTVSGTGTHRKLENTPGPSSLRNADGTLRGYVAARFLPLRAGELFPVKADILNVRAEPNGQAALIGELARDTMVRFSGNGDFVKLEYVEQYVRAADLRSEYVPARRDGVFVPETPIPIKAGDLIGHIGEYQNARDSLPRRQLHLEVFCVDWFPGFLKDSRAWAERLPAKEKTWLKLPKGTAVIFHQEGFNQKSLPASGQPHLTSDADLLVPKSLLDNLPAQKRIIHTAADPEQNRTWYRLENLFHDAKGNLVDGWIEDPGETSWVSPWSWDGYEVVETSGSPVQGMAYRMVQDKNTSEEDRARLRQQADAWNKGPLLTRLYEIIDRNRDRQMCADEVRTALNTPALAQALSKIVLRSESEWYYREGKWDALDTVFGHTTSAPLVNWMAEKTRIRELSWWGDTATLLNLPEKGSIYFLHPLSLFSAFHTYKFTLETMKKIFTGVSSSAHAELQEMVDELNNHIELYKLNTPLRRAHFFAQILQETGKSLNREESFRHSITSLKLNFRYFRLNPEEAEELGYASIRYIKRNNQPMTHTDLVDIANRAYGNRIGNGDIASGDGWRYRGRGLKQLTGRGNYESLLAWHQRNSSHWPLDSPDFLAEPGVLLNIKYATRSAAYFWVQNRLYELADNGSQPETVNSITKIVNLHTDSYLHRRNNFKRFYEQGYFQ